MKFQLGTCFVCVIALFVIPIGSANAHGIFKKTLESKHKTIRVTCNMCHVKGKEKSELNEFGELFFQKFKGKDFSAKWDALERDERKKFEKTIMAPTFLAALEKINKMENGDGEKYGDLIPIGKIQGSKPKKKKKTK